MGGAIMVKPQYLTGFLKARIRAVRDRIRGESGSFRHLRFRVNRVFLTDEAVGRAK
jgi:hypothetical protein